MHLAAAGESYTLEFKRSTAAVLSQPHPSVLRNPLLAGAFHRTGAVEVWGSGTNRVIEACREHGIAPPEYSEQAGVVTVTFRGNLSNAPQGPSRDQAGTKLEPSQEQLQVLELAQVPRSLKELIRASQRTNRSKFRDQVLAPLLRVGWLELTVPGKPRSPQQRYRTTPAGLARIGRAGPSGDER